jgi:TonB family protein
MAGDQDALLPPDAALMLWRLPTLVNYLFTIFKQSPFPFLIFSPSISEDLCRTVQADTWVGIQFSDGTKKAASYDFSHPPRLIAGLLRKIDTTAANCPSEMVFSGGKPTPTVSDVRPVKVVEAVYPESARSAKIHGSVVVYVIVGRTGDVETVTAANGPEKLRQAAIDAVQQWKWNPLRLNRKPLRFRTKAVVHFVLHKKNASAK